MRKVQVATIIALILNLGFQQVAEAATQQELRRAKLNKRACASILKKTEAFEAKRATIDSENYKELRRTYMAYAKYLDSFYYRIYDDLAEAVLDLRNEVWQVADRSADVMKVQRTTNDEAAIADLDYAINNAMAGIELYIPDLTEVCQVIDNPSQKVAATPSATPSPSST